MKSQLKFKGGVVELKPHESASQRTKNRIFDNGPHFTINLHTNNCVALGDVEAVLVIAHSTDWMGWLPVDEIVVI